MNRRERNAALVREAVEAFEQRNVPGLLEFLDPEIECHVADGLVNTGTWDGLQGFAEMSAAWEEPWSEISYEARDVETPDEDHVLVHIHQTATGAQSGVPVELDVVYMVEVRDERAVRLHIYPDRERALAATSAEAGETAPEDA
jgi:ketosteroid isomerase-like protein